jgi:hypothetical protein
MSRMCTATPAKLFVVTTGCEAGPRRNWFSSAPLRLCAERRRRRGPRPSASLIADGFLVTRRVLRTDRESHHNSLFRSQRVPDVPRHSMDGSAVIGVPAPDIADTDQRARRLTLVRRAPVQHPGMTNQHIADIQQNR